MFLPVKDHPKCATAEAHPLEVSQPEDGWSLLPKSPRPRKEDSALRLRVSLQSPPPFHSFESYLTRYFGHRITKGKLANRVPDLDPVNSLRSSMRVTR